MYITGNPFKRCAHCLTLQKSMHHVLFVAGVELFSARCVDECCCGLFFFSNDNGEEEIFCAQCCGCVGVRRRELQRQCLASSERAGGLADVEPRWQRGGVNVPGDWVWSRVNDEEVDGRVGSEMDGREGNGAGENGDGG